MCNRHVLGANMLPYPASFSADDRARVFRFLATFSRWECALKHGGFARVGRQDQVEPDWRAFAVAHDADIAALTDPAFTAARDALLANPPRREELNGTLVEWRANPRRPAEHAAADYLLRIVKDVRNNLFHGGKFIANVEPE